MGVLCVSSFASHIEGARRYRLLPYYFALRLHRCHATRRRIEDWWSQPGLEEDAASAWLTLLAGLPPEHRPRLARWLHRNPAVRSAPPSPDAARLLRFAALLHRPEFVARYAGDFVTWLAGGTPADFLEGWLTLRAQPEHPHCYVSGHGAPGSTLPVERILALAGEGKNRRRMIERLFYSCSDWRGTAAFLLRPELDLLTPPECCHLAEFAAESADDEFGPAYLGAWLTLPAEARTQLAGSPLSAMHSGFSAAGPSRIRPILTRWSSLKNASRAGLEELVALLPNLSGPGLLDEALGISDAALSQLGKACQGASNALRLDGRESLFRADPALGLRWLLASPKQCIETLIWLGGYGRVRARRLLHQAVRLNTALFGVRSGPAAGGAADHLVRLDRLLASHRTEAERLPGFDTWDRHFAGTKVLKPTEIEAVARRLAAAIPTLQMRWIKETIQRELTSAPAFVQPHQGSDPYVPLFRASLEWNRRALTRYLRSQTAGAPDVRLSHAANRQWLARQQDRFNLEAWLNPACCSASRLTAATAEAGHLTLSIETNPVEILKIGSYVGSCLAIGGLNSHAVVAILLDANKRVVFARNARGRFVARQVIAISDDAKLVCYPVYPRQSGRDVEDAFAIFAAGWASALALPLATGADTGVTERVKALAVQHWYDDGLWDRLCE